MICRNPFHPQLFCDSVTSIYFSDCIGLGITTLQHVSVSPVRQENSSNGSLPATDLGLELLFSSVGFLASLRRLLQGLSSRYCCPRL